MPITRKGALYDIDAVKSMADQHRKELGFIMRPSLVASVERGELIVAIGEQEDIVGFVHYRHLMDVSSTLYHICVDPMMRKQGTGRKLVNELLNEACMLNKTHIKVKCPSDLPANSFYKHCGFELIAVEQGKKRELSVWVKRLK